jgi:hypothetical protein
VADLPQLLQDLMSLPKQMELQTMQDPPTKNPGTTERGLDAIARCQ